MGGNDTKLIYKREYHAQGGLIGEFITGGNPMDAREVKQTIEKIKRLAQMRKDKNLQFEIQVDGGINTTNGAQKRALGVDNLVGGSTIFLSDDIKETVRLLKA
jgi:3-keto-L-gulonate-6-phosphate decarboxylase